VSCEAGFEVAFHDLGMTDVVLLCARPVCVDFEGFGNEGVG